MYIQCRYRKFNWTVSKPDL